MNSAAHWRVLDAAQKQNLLVPLVYNANYVCAQRWKLHPIIFICIYSSKIMQNKCMREGLHLPSSLMRHPHDRWHIFPSRFDINLILGPEFNKVPYGRWALQNTSLWTIWWSKKIYMLSPGFPKLLKLRCNNSKWLWVQQEVEISR